MNRRAGGARDEHDDFRMLAAASIDGRIDADSAAVLERHVATCARCRAFHRGLQQDQAWLVAPGPVAEPRARVREAVLEAARAPTVPRTSDSPRPWPALAAAAVIVAVVAGGLLLARQPFGWQAFGGPPSSTPASLVPSELATTPAPTPVQGASTAPAAPCALRPSGLTAWWTGDDERDVVGGRDLQPHGRATFTPGLVGRALTLDGLNAYADVPHAQALDLGTGDFTVLLWVRLNTQRGEQVLIEQWRDGADGAPPAGWTFTKLADRRLLFTGASALGGQGVETAPIALLADTWYQVAARRTGSTLAIFLNGSVIAEQAAPSPIDLSLDTPLLFGRRGTGNGYLLDGQLDEIQLFVGRALPATEIAAVYRAGASGICAP
jgi:hypothetical protein